MSVYGVGINDANYYTTGSVGGTWSICPYYSRWRNMLKRCYCPNYREKYPTYQGCYACDEWLTFSNFKAWMEQQDWENKELDKDLLVIGNKCYSPTTCVFISPAINSLIIWQKRSTGGLLAGVGHHSGTGKFRAICRNPFTRKGESLGLFHAEIDAHLAWKKRKRELVVEVAASIEDDKIKQALLQHYKHEDTTL